MGEKIFEKSSFRNYLQKFLYKIEGGFVLKGSFRCKKL